MNSDETYTQLVLSARSGRWPAVGTIAGILAAAGRDYARLIADIAQGGQLAPRDPCPVCGMGRVGVRTSWVSADGQQRTQKLHCPECRRIVGFRVIAEASTKGRQSSV